MPLQVQPTGTGCPHGSTAPSCPQVGDITILVNNAAVVHGKSLMDSDDDALLKSQHVNTLGQFWVRGFLAGPEPATGSAGSLRRVVGKEVQWDQGSCQQGCSTAK